MEELESQIAKIQLGNIKSSSTYVYITAEKAPVGSAELYVVAELPLLNPAAEESCERICQAISSTLKRAYRNPGMANNFESAISQINEELGKLASLGQTGWVDKLNCILGVKEGESFNIATTGKVSAYLLRNREYTDISCSPDQSHPLKTFENYATGKIHLGDLLILSTTQLFNYLSMDRLRSVIGNSNFLTAAQTVIALLKENADPQVSFGVLLNLQVPFGQAEEKDEDLESYVTNQPAKENVILTNIKKFVAATFAFYKKDKRIPKTDIPKIGNNFGQRLKNLSGNAKDFVNKSKGLWQTAKTSAGSVKTTVSNQNFKNFSKEKKFFLISTLVLLIVVTASIVVAVRLKSTRQVQSQISNQFKAAQTAILNAQSSLLYKDYTTASTYIQQAKNSLPTAKSVSSSDKAQYDKLVSELSDLTGQMEKVVQAKVTSLGSLAQGSSLISLPNFIATQSKPGIISYNKQTGQIQDGALKSSVAVVDSLYISGNIAVIYDGTSLYAWDFSTGNVGTGFSQDVPAKNNFGGMAFYPTNNRVYVANKQAGQIISFVLSKNKFSKPIISIQNSSVTQTVDITIDTAIYALNQTGINKFLGGKPTNFNISGLANPFSGSGKIYTQKSYKFIYILDSANNRIIILNKDGSLLETLKSDQFTKLLDFSVDEPNKTIYLLNDNTLLKTGF